MFDPLVMMLTWWLNRKDREGRGSSAADSWTGQHRRVRSRSAAARGGSLEQGDATGWMAMFQLNMAAIAFELAMHDPHYEPMVHRFGQDFVIVANVLQSAGGSGVGIVERRTRLLLRCDPPRQ
jgi:hypothetical protein